MRNWIAGIMLCVLASTAIAAGKKLEHKKIPKQPPDIKIVEFGLGKELTWTGLQVPDIVIPLTIFNAGKEKAENISVHVTTFHGSGRTAAPAVTPKGPFTVASHQETPVNVLVTLPSAAT